MENKQEKQVKKYPSLIKKQINKKGNSSPLGLLIDHGCDAIIVTI